MTPTLGGFIGIRNGSRLDYCWREAVQSLLPICDEVLICDCDSDDGTRETMDEWAHREPKITLANFPWTNPIATNQWWPDFLNYARQHLKTEFAITVDADELIHENSYDIIRRAVEARKSVICHRYNFWRDARSLIPPGVCCGTDVIRIGPQNQWMPSDYPDPRAEWIQRNAVMTSPRVEIYHYGFLRERKAFFRKAREVQRIWVNSYDPRLEKAETFEGNWAEMPGITSWEDKLVPFSGTHPALIHNWLRERNHDPN